MPPKGRKKAILEAVNNSNGISKPMVVEKELPAANLKEKIQSSNEEVEESGRSRRAIAESGDAFEKPIFKGTDEVFPKKVDTFSEDKEDSDIVEVNVNMEVNDGIIASLLKKGSKVEEETETSNGKAVADDARDQAVSKQDEAVESDDEIIILEDKVESKKVSGRQGPKIIKIEPTELEIKSNGKILLVLENETAISSAKIEPEKASGKRGQKKAENQAAAEDKEVTRSKEGASTEKEMVATEAESEPEESTGRRGRKKAEHETLAKQEEEEKKSDAKSEMPSVTEPEEKAATSSKRVGNAKPDATAKSVASKNVEEDSANTDENLAPRKTRGGRNAKDNSKTLTAATNVDDEETDKEAPRKTRGGRNAKVSSKALTAATNVDDEEADKEAPRKTRGGRNAKDNSKALAVAANAENEEADKKAPRKTRGGRNAKDNPKAITAATNVDDEEPNKEEPRKTRGGRNAKDNSKSLTAATNVDDEEVDKESPRKTRGGRNAKNSSKGLTAATNVDDEEADKEAPRKTRGGRNAKDSSKGLTAAANAEDDNEDEDFAPRKTRGGRYAKDSSKEEVPVTKGRKRKVMVEEVEEKQTKKSKIDTHEEQIDVKLQLRVNIQRDIELDAIAMNSSTEDIEDTKMKSGKGPAKSTSRKRGKQDADDSKPAKVPKEEPSKSKGASKKQQIPDVTALDFANTSKSPDGKPWNLKIASWNINGVRAWLEKNGLSYLHHEKPDILCLQETKCSDDKLPEDILKVEGYHCHWLAGDKDGYSGVGILSKEKPISITDGIGVEDHDKEGRAITAEYEKFYLVTTYVPNSGRGLVRLDYRMQWDKDFRAYLKKLDEQKPVILCGDLNVAHEEIDIANPKSNKRNAGFTNEERDSLSTLLEEGFVDTFRHLYPDTKAAYTFWTYMSNARAKNVGWRLDYFLISKRFTDNLCDNVIRKDVLGSDHCPIGLLLHV